MLPTIRPLKVIVVGSSGVGKTSLINVFIGEGFDCNAQPTIAPAFCSKEVRLPDGNAVELHIWDTAGQEKFQSIGGMFYRDADIAIVCFDASTMGSIPEWAARVREQVSDCAILLAGTKSDLLSDEGTGPFMAAGNRYKDDVNARAFFLTSASANVGITELYSFAASCRQTVWVGTRPPVVDVGTADATTKRAGCAC
jgi:small GTP-binding protein